MRNRKGQRVGPYEIVDHLGECANGLPLWLAYSHAEQRLRSVTEAKVRKMGRRYGFEG